MRWGLHRRANAELASLYEADQQDRRGDIRWEELLERDRARRRRVEELIGDGALRGADDHFHAAMVFQHGEAPDDYQRAHELAVAAVELGMDRARWLAAAALDRRLMSEGRPQRYGTQYRSQAGRWVLYDVDPATTDDQRAEWNVPPLAEAHERAERMTRHDPPPDAGPAS